MKTMDHTSSVFLYIGLVLSLLGLLYQGAVYLVVPCSRKRDQKILTQISAARILRDFHSIFMSMYLLDKDIRVFESKQLDPLLVWSFMFLIVFDFALLCWMYAFTKELYKKVSVLCYEFNFAATLAAVWTLAFSVGFFNLLLFRYAKNFTAVWGVYTCTAYLLNLMNVFFLCRICYLAYFSTERKVGVMYSCLAMILVGITSSSQSLALFLTTQMRHHNVEDPLSDQFGVINAYQIVPITVLFTVFTINNVKILHINSVSLSYV